METLKNELFTKSIHEYSNLIKKKPIQAICKSQSTKQRHWPYESILCNKNLKSVKFSTTQRQSIEDFLTELRDVKMILCKLLQNQWSILRDFDRRRGMFFKLFYSVLDKMCEFISEIDNIKKKRRSFTVYGKLEVVEYTKNNSISATSKRFNIDRNTVRDWRKQENELIRLR